MRRRRTARGHRNFGLIECAARRGATARAFDPPTSRCSSTPPARRACPRRRASPMRACCAPCSAFAAAVDVQRRRTASMSACRCTTPTAAPAAQGMALAAGASVVHSRALLRERVLDRRRCAKTARCSSISANSAAISSTRRRRRTIARIASAPVSATACGPTSSKAFQQRFGIRGCWSSTARPKATSSCSTSIRARRHRPHPLLGRARFPMKVVALRRRDQHAQARRRRPLHRRAPDEVGECSGEIRDDPNMPRRALRRLRRPRRDKAEGAARRVRARATPGSAPATSAPRRAAATSISSTASATPSAGRARTSRPPRSPRRSRSFRACRKSIVYGVAVPRPGRPRRHGRAGGRQHRRVRSRRAARLSRRAPAGLCAPAVPALSLATRRDRHLQAEEDGSGRRRLRSRARQEIPSSSTTARRAPMSRSTRRCWTRSRRELCGCDDPGAVGRSRRASRSRTP